MRKRLDALSRLTGPHFGRSVGRCREEAVGESIAIDIPNRSLVSIEGS